MSESRLQLVPPLTFDRILSMWQVILGWKLNRGPSVADQLYVLRVFDELGDAVRHDYGTVVFETLEHLRDRELGRTCRGWLVYANHMLDKMLGTYDSHDRPSPVRPYGVELDLWQLVLAWKMQNRPELEEQMKAVSAFNLISTRFVTAKGRELEALRAPADGSPSQATQLWIKKALSDLPYPMFTDRANFLLNPTGSPKGCKPPKRQ